MSPPTNILTSKWVLDSVDRCWNCWAADHQNNCPHRRLSISDSEERRNKLKIKFPMRDPRGYIKVAYPTIGCYNCWESIEHRAHECPKPKKTDTEREILRKEMAMPCFSSWKDRMDLRGIAVDRIGGKPKPVGLENCLRMIVRMTKASGGGMGDFWAEELIKENAGLAGIPSNESGLNTNENTVGSNAKEPVEVDGMNEVEGDGGSNINTPAAATQNEDRKVPETSAAKDVVKNDEDKDNTLELVTSEYLNVVHSMMPAANPAALEPKKKPAVAVGCNFSDLKWDGDFGIGSQEDRRRGALLNKPVSTFRSIQQSAEHLCWNCWEEHPRIQCPDANRTFRDADILRRNKRISRPINNDYNEKLANLVCSNCWRTTDHDRKNCDKPSMAISIRETIRCAQGIPLTNQWINTLRSNGSRPKSYGSSKNWDSDIRVGGKTDLERIKEDAEAAAALKREKEQQAAATAAAAAAAARRAAEPARRKYVHYLPLPDEGEIEGGVVPTPKPLASIQTTQPIMKVQPVKQIPPTAATATVATQPKKIPKGINNDCDSDSDPNPGEFVARPAHRPTQKEAQQEKSSTKITPLEENLIDLSIPPVLPAVVRPAQIVKPTTHSKEKTVAIASAPIKPTAGATGVAKPQSSESSGAKQAATIPSKVLVEISANVDGRVKESEDVVPPPKTIEESSHSSVRDLGENTADTLMASQPASLICKAEEIGGGSEAKPAIDTIVPKQEDNVSDDGSSEHSSTVQVYDYDVDLLNPISVALFDVFNEFKAFRQDLCAAYTNVASAMQSLVESQACHAGDGNVMEESSGPGDVEGNRSIIEVEKEEKDELEIEYKPSDIKRNAPLTGRVRKGYPFYMNVYQN